MKKILISAIATAAMVTSVFGQGQMLTLDNIANTSSSSTATSGGLVWTNNTGSGQSGLVNQDLNIILLGGTSAGSLAPLTPVAQLLLGGSGSGVGDLILPGIFLDPGALTYDVVGAAPGSIVVLEVQAWLGSTYTDYASALADPNAYVTRTLIPFNNTTGNQGGSPPVTASDLTGMPALILSNLVPEPGTLALAGLGLATLLVFRRRS